MTEPGRTTAATVFAERLFGNRYLLWLAVAIILMSGYSALVNLPRIEDPRITNRNVRITTILPGASAERVEALVTEKIENELEELAEIKRLESRSRSGISIVLAELQDDIGSPENQQVFARMRDKLADVAPLLPAGASEPALDDKAEAVAFSVITALRWIQPGEPPLGLMTRLAEQLGDELRAIPGTDIVRFYGEPEEEITVDVDADALAEMGLGAADVAALIAGGDPKLPAGALRTDRRSLLIEVDGELDSVAAVAATPLIGNGAGGSVSLGDVADVARGWRTPPAEIGWTNGERTIFVGARTEPDIRVDEWAASAREAIAGFDKRLGRGVDASVIFDQSVYTQARLASLGGNLFAGAVVVMLVVFIGMGWRAALIVGAALPLSGSLAMFGLKIVGQQLHQMSIFGFIVAIGLLIDNAIVMTDEVKKHLDDGCERLVAIRQSIAHLFVPLFASTFTTILGFMPVFLLPGAMGDFVGPIAISVVLALVASFAVSVTIIPSLAGIFLRRRGDSDTHEWWRDGFASDRLAAAYRRVLRGSLQRPLITVAACVAVPLSGFVLAGTLGQEFFPPADRDQFEIQVWLPGDASIERTSEVTRRIDDRLAGEDGIRDVHWMVGHSFPSIYYNRIMNVQQDPAYAHAMVYTNDVDAASALTRRLSFELGERFPEARIVVAPFAQGPPVEAPVGFRLEGPDVATLRSLGDELRRIMHTVPDVLQTRATVTSGEPRLAYAVDEIAARQSGLTLAGISRQLQTNLEGRTGGSVREGREELPVRIRYRQSSRDSVAQIAAARLIAGDTSLAASSLGDLRLEPRAGGIARRDGRRVNEVYAYIRSGALGIEVSDEILRRLDASGFELPAGYALYAAGESNEQSEAIGKLTTYLPILGLLMLATIVLSFRSLRLAGVIGVVALLSIGLGLLSLWLGGYVRSFNAIIGTAGLIGVAINGTIVVIAAIRADDGARTGNVDGIVEQTARSTRHIVSTVFTTMGGFVPLIVFSGGDFWPPLAVVIAGGVGLSVILSLFFTPVVYRLLFRRRATGTVPLPAGEPA